MTPYIRGVLLALAGTFFYSMLGLSIKFAGQLADTWQIMAGRGVLGIALAIVLARLMHLTLLGQNLLGIALTAFANFTAAALITIALTRIPLFDALVLWYLLPVWSMLLAVRFLGENITPIKVVFVALAIVGISVVLWPQSERDISSLDWGHAAAACSSFAAASAFVLIRRQSKEHALCHFFHFCLIALLFSCLLLSMRTTPALPPLIAWPPIILVAIAGILGQTLIFRAIAYIPPTETTLITMGEIILSAIAAWAFFDETITVRQLFGGGMILIAGVGINVQKAYQTRQHSYKSMRMKIVLHADTAHKHHETEQ